MIDTLDIAQRYAQITANLFRSAWPQHGENIDANEGLATVYVADEALGDHTPLPDAGLITSAIVDGRGNVTDAHKVLLDIDVDAVLLPSSHPGHHHLLIDHVVTKAQHDEILDVLARAGIVEEGYAEASKNRSYGACLRPPWKTKPGTSSDRRAFADRFRDAVAAFSAPAPATTKPADPWPDTKEN